MKREFITIAVFLAAMNVVPTSVSGTETGIQSYAVVESTISARETLMESIIILVAERSGVRESDIKPESRFIEDLGMDSLDFVELIMDCEELYRIKIPNSDYRGLTTVQYLYDYVRAKIMEDL